MGIFLKRIKIKNPKKNRLATRLPKAGEYLIVKKNNKINIIKYNYDK